MKTTLMLTKDNCVEIQLPNGKYVTFFTNLDELTINDDHIISIAKTFGYSTDLIWELILNAKQK